MAGFRLTAAAMDFMNEDIATGSDWNIPNMIEPVTLSANVSTNHEKISVKLKDFTK